MDTKLTITARLPIERLLLLPSKGKSEFVEQALDFALDKSDGVIFTWCDYPRSGTWVHSTFSVAYNIACQYSGYGYSAEGYKRKGKRKEHLINAAIGLWYDRIHGHRASFAKMAEVRLPYRMGKVSAKQAAEILEKARDRCDKFHGL